MKGNNQYGSTINGFLISGITTASTGKALNTFGMNKFNIFSEGLVNPANSQNASGTVTVQARVHEGASWTSLSTVNFCGNSGVLVQSLYPWQALRAMVPTYFSGKFNVSYIIQQ